MFQGLRQALSEVSDTLLSHGKLVDLLELKAHGLCLTVHGGLYPGEKE